MALTPTQMIITIAAIALGVQIWRWLPFIAFPESKGMPPLVAYLGKILPPALMAFLVVYSLRNTPVLTFPHGLPEMIAMTAVILTYRWKENMLLSVGSGTVIYMILLQRVFLT